MAERVRLGLIGASVSGTWSARAPFTGAAGQLGGRVDGGLHNEGRQRRGGAQGLGRPAGF